MPEPRKKHLTFDYAKLRKLTKERCGSLNNAFADNHSGRVGFYETERKQVLPMLVPIAHLFQSLELTPDEIASLFVLKK